MHRFSTAILALTLLSPQVLHAQARDSVKMEVGMYVRFIDIVPPYYGAGIYATWPDIAAEVLSTETGYSTYSLVATEGQYVPFGFGEITDKSQPPGSLIPDGWIGHNPQIANGGSIVFMGQGVEFITRALSGAEIGRNGGPFHISDWYAVYNVPPSTPIAFFEWNQSAAKTISFDAGFRNSREVELEGAKPVVKYEWDFGDGNTGSGAKPAHVYEQAGNYTVTLTVTDDDDETDDHVAVVEVTEVNLEYRTFAEEHAYAGDTLRVFANIHNSGTASVFDVNVSRVFPGLPSFPNGSENTRNAKADPLIATADTIIAEIGPGETVRIDQQFVITSGATQLIDGVRQNVPVDWEFQLYNVAGVDDRGTRIVATDFCAAAECANVTRIETAPLLAELSVSTVDGEAGDVSTGLSRYTSDLFPNGIFQHLVLKD
ncbi:MAG: PKD domain-containing protein, partial [Bacteroidetes bacterium]|nr:PKD domain-containing protein [Bacteroidota bacterium]